MRTARALVLLLVASTWSACPRTSTTVDGGAPECATRAECAAGQVCTPDKRCSGCESSGQCGLKEACDPQTFLCGFRPGWGAECAAHEACAAGQWCVQGLCVERSQALLCAGGTAAQCPTGKRCNEVTSVCEEDLGCATDDDCGAGEKCNLGSHVCRPACTVDTQATVCAVGERCVGEQCVECETSADCAAGLSCDAAGKCSSGARCYQDRDCKVPLVCYLSTGACVTQPPPCVSDESCPGDKRCDVGAGRCVPRACQPDRGEPNNELGQAFGVTASQYVDLTLCENDVDYFALSLARGDQLGVNLDADPFAESTFTTSIRDGEGRTLASGKLLVSYVAPLAATYYVAVSTTDRFQPYDATFLLSRGDPCDDDGFEPNDLGSQATPVNKASSLDGAICPQDIDHFRVTVPAGKGLSAALTPYDASGGLLRLCVLDGETPLGCSDEPSVPTVTVPSAQAGGRELRVRVTGSTERVANRYTLQVVFP